ncbi:MAG: hypothetical protein Q8941_16665 [Bacteroidota bacterium]|nr:hypothetical protein [Bacteroidota bacterium]
MTTTTRQSYLDQLSEFETTPLFLTNRTDSIESEIHNNSVFIGLTKEIAKQVSINDFTDFLAKVKLNRRDQLFKSYLNIDLIYYLWFDEMAGQLRLNFINSNHVSLPFKCNLIFVDTEQQIIDAFLNSSYLEGIPFDELTDVENSDEETHDNASPHNLKIYRETIARKISR